MKKVLLVQRQFTHYRRSLIKCMTEQGEFAFDVLNIGTAEANKDNVHTFTAKKLFQYKNYSIEKSNGLINYIKQHYSEYDYIILEGATNLSNNLPIVRFLKKKGKPYVVWDAGRRKNSKMSMLRKIAQGKLEFVWRNAAAIIAYSTLAKSYFESIGIQKEKVFVCQNTLCVREFDEQIRRITDEEVKEVRKKFTNDNGKIILYVGAIESRKRIKDLIDAFGLVFSQNSNTSLVIIGGGVQLQELQEYTKGRKNIYLLGQIIDGVIKFFMACDVFALPSEGGLSLNQAMICGKPIIASSADGTELDLIEENFNGYIFEETNIRDFSEKILSIINDPEKMRSMGERSRRIIEERINEREFYHNFKQCLNSVKRINKENLQEEK